MAVIGEGFVGLFDMPDSSEPEKKCHLCLRKVALSREHVPPQAAFNDQKRVWERFNPWQSRRPLDQRTARSQVLRETWQSGFYVETLCAGCNSETGGNTVKAYVEFVRSIANAGFLFSPHTGKRVLRAQGDTLTIARQIAVMILAIERIEFGTLHADLRAFARGDLIAVVPPFRVLAFFVPDRTEAGTISRTQFRMDSEGGGARALAGEISMFPFGVVYAFELERRYRPAALADITHWFSSTALVERHSAWLETSTAVTVLDSVHCSLGNPRYYPQIDTVLPRQP